MKNTFSSRKVHLRRSLIRLQIRRLSHRAIAPLSAIFRRIVAYCPHLVPFSEHNTLQSWANAPLSQQGEAVSNEQHCSLLSPSLDVGREKIFRTALTTNE